MGIHIAAIWRGRRVWQTSAYVSARWGYHRLGYCMAGFSATFDKVSHGGQRRRSMSKPISSLGWREPLHGCTRRLLLARCLGHATIGLDRQWRPDAHQRESGPLRRSVHGYVRWVLMDMDVGGDFGYLLGYAVASGDLDGNEGSDVAVGIPKGASLLGVVRGGGGAWPSPAYSALLSIFRWPSITRGIRI